MGPDGASYPSGKGRGRLVSMGIYAVSQKLVSSFPKSAHVPRKDVLICRAYGYLSRSLLSISGLLPATRP